MADTSRPERASRFKYVFIPADSSYPMETREHDQVSLEDDTFITMIKKYFASSNPESGVDRDVLLKQMSEHAKTDVTSALDPDTLERLMSTTSVDILSIAVPSRENSFIGVSLYCDDKGKSKKLQLNERACGLGAACGLVGHTFHGDIFLSRMYDDGEDHWYRTDLSVSDVSSDAAWVKRAAELAAKKLSSGPASLSGIAERFLANTGQSPMSLETHDAAPSVNVSGETENFKWYQTSDEIEITIPADGSITKAMIRVDIKQKSLRVTVDQKVIADGELFEAIDSSESTWTFSAKDKLLQVTLSKRAPKMWETVFRK